MTAEIGREEERKTGRERRNWKLKEEGIKGWLQQTIYKDWTLRSAQRFSSSSIFLHGFHRSENQGHWS